MSTLREVQLKGYEILNTVVDLCEQHNLTYYLSCGTLLGTIRHHGFIPWDNDIDIEMPVKDYRKFLHIAKKELPQNLFVQTYISDPGYNEMWAKIRANDTTSLPLAWKKLDIHWGIGIDIFPLIGIYENRTLHKFQRKVHTFCRFLLSKDFMLSTNSPELSIRKLQPFLGLPRPLRIALCRIFEVFTFKNPQTSKNASIVFTKIDYLVNYAAYNKGISAQFESRKFMIPENYDHVLTRLYGDYMTPPPEAERNGHEGSLGKIIYDCNRSYKEYIADFQSLTNK